MSKNLNMVKQRKANLEIGRKEAGNYATKASFQLLQKIEREEKPILQVCVHIPEDFFAYDALPGYPQAGDVIGVFPQNKPAHQDLLKETLICSPFRRYFLKGRHETDEGSWYTLENALKYVSLNPVKIEVLQLIQATLTQISSIPSEMYESRVILHDLLKLYATDPESCREILSHTHLTDVLQAFPGLLDLQDICTLQGANYRRVYTISGIEKVKDQRAICIQFMVATGVSYVVPPQSFNSGKVYEGVCLGYLQDLLKDYPSQQEKLTLEVFTQHRMFGAPEKNRAFIPNRQDVMPKTEFLAKLRLPLLLIAAGSGISGVRAILEERFLWKKQGYEVGRSTLLLGIHNRHTDYLYKADWERFEQAGVIDNIVLAESRPSIGKKCYVQDFLSSGTLDSALIEIAGQQRGLIICGDCQMGKSILQGYLPLLLPKVYPASIPSSSHHLLTTHNRKSLRKLHRLGIDLVNNLQEQGMIIMSASGSRHTKSDIIFDEIYQKLYSNTSAYL